MILTDVHTSEAPELMADGTAATGANENDVARDVDFDKPGKQTGFIQVPHSVHEDAWGVIPVPSP